MKYDVIIIRAGTGGIFAAYEWMKDKPAWKGAVLQGAESREKRRGPFNGDKGKTV